MKKVILSIVILILFLSFSKSFSQKLVLQNGHSKEVKLVKFSPAGQNIFSVGGDKKLKVYNNEGYLLKTFHRFKDEYLEGVFTADGKKLYLYSFSQDSVYRIDLMSLEIDQAVSVTEPDSPFQARGAGLSPDGEKVRIVMANKDYEKPKADFQVIEISPDGTSKIIKVGEFIGDDYGSLVGPNAKRLIHFPYIDKKSTTVLFDIETNKPIQEFFGARGFRFTHSGSEIYELIGPDEEELGVLKFYDSSTGIESRTIKLSLGDDHESDLYFKHIKGVFYFDEIQTIVAQVDVQYEGSRLLFFDVNGDLQHESRHGLYGITAFDIAPATSRMAVCTGSPGENIPNQMHFFYYEDFVSAQIKSLKDVSEAFQISFADDNKSFVVSRKNGWSKIDLHGNILKEVPFFASPFLCRSSNQEYLLSTGYEQVLQHDVNGNLIKTYKLENDPVTLASDGESNMVLVICLKYIYGIDTEKREVVFEKNYEEFHEKTGNYLQGAASLNDQFYLFGQKMVEIIDYKGNKVKEVHFEDMVISNFISNQPMSVSKEAKTIIGRPGFSQLHVFGIDGEINNTIFLPWVKFKHNGVNATTMRSDGQIYAIGSTIGEVRIIDQEGKLLHFTMAHENEVSSMAFSPDGKYLATGSVDGDIILWDVENNYEKLLTYYVFEEGQFLVITPEGYYHASKDALDKFIYFKDGRIYRFDNYDLKFNRPDIIMDKLSLMDEEIIRMYKKAYNKRLTRAGVSDNTLSAEFEEIPSVTLPKTKFYQRVKSSEFSFRIEAKGASAPLSKLFVYVNGSPVYGINGKEISSSNSKALNEECSFQLNSGRNLISVAVLDEKGVESLRQKFIVDYERSYNPTLHFMIVGVSEFQNKSMNLTYAAKDANDLKKQFKSSNPIYKKTKIYDLTDKNATKENVLKTLELLKASDPDDAVIIHVSSHGVLDAEMDYYLAMHDMYFDNPVEGGLSYDLLEEEISKIPSRKKVLMLDACHSGELDKEEFEISSNSIYTVKGEVNFRSVGSQVNSKSIGFDNSLELSKRIFSDMKRSSGTLVLSSAGAVEYALESDEWKNGVFTFAILQGLQEAEADLNEDGEITFKELQEYVIDQVDILTEGGQKPNIRTNNSYCEEVRIW